MTNDGFTIANSTLVSRPTTPRIRASAVSELELQQRKFEKELSTGTMSLVLLAVLEQAEDDLYGYQIAKQLEALGPGVLSGKQSALYPVLRNLSNAGLLDSHVLPSQAGPPRRYYRITEFGRQTYDQWRKTWAETCEAVQCILEGSQS